MRYTKKYCSIMGKAILTLSMAVVFAFAGHAHAGLSRQADATIVDSSNAGLAWMPDGSTPSVNKCAGGKKTWAGAFDYVACLNSSNYLGHSDWRLPTVEELSNLGTIITTGQMSIAATLNANGFSNVQSAYYWTSSGGTDIIAMAVDKLWDGQAHPMNKASMNYVIAVRTAGN